ncbi:MAG: hypothetical protein V1861_00030 [Candidatus Micrarchaeota archaeon]
MAGEEDTRRRRDALLAMHAQGGKVQKPPVMRPPEVQPPRDLSQLRPVVRDDVGRRQEDARQVFTFAMTGFMAAKPEIEREMRRDGSQLLALYQMSQS